MDDRSEDRVLAILATLCAATVAAMVVAIVWTKSSQDFFQTARSVEAFTAHLAASPLNPLGLRINLGLDNLFLILYAAAFFVVLTARLRDMLDVRILTIALAAILMTTFLDALENHHIIKMEHAIESGLPISAADGQFQMVASQLKFHASYLSVLLYSLGFWQFGRLGRVIAVVLWCYIPCGVLISVIPPDTARLLVLGRTIFFVFAFVMSAILFFAPPRTQHSEA
jgi:hypothetical protein